MTAATMKLTLIASVHGTETIFDPIIAAPKLLKLH